MSTLTPKEVSQQELDKLRTTLKQEYQDFIADLKTQNVDVIISKSYEKVFKEEIAQIFDYFESNADENGDFRMYNHLEINLERLQNLNSINRPLDYLYQGWLDCDASYLEDLSLAIDNEISNIKD